MARTEERGLEGQAGVPLQRPRVGRASHHELLEAERAFYPPPPPMAALLPPGFARCEAAASLPARGRAFGAGRDTTRAGISAASSQRKISPTLPCWRLQAGKPLNKAPSNPSEVLLPIRAQRELCLSTKSLKPSPNHLICISTTSLFPVTFPLAHGICGLPDNSLTSLSARVFQLLSWHCAGAAVRTCEGSTGSVEEGLEGKAAFQLLTSNITGTFGFAEETRASHQKPICQTSTAALTSQISRREQGYLGQVLPVLSRTTTLQAGGDAPCLPAPIRPCSGRSFLTGSARRLSKSGPEGPGSEPGAHLSCRTLLDAYWRQRSREAAPKRPSAPHPRGPHVTRPPL